MTPKQPHPSSRSSHLAWVMILAALLDIACASAVSSVDLNTETESFSLNSENPPESGFRLKFLQKPTADDAVAQKKGELYLRHRDDEEDNNDSSKRYRRDADVNMPSPPAEDGKVITTNWGTYEEQAPVVIESASRTLDPEDDEPIFSDGVQSRESADQYGSPAGVGSISYEEYEDGRFEEGRQFYPSRDGAEEQEQPDGYYRQKYYATTPSREEGLLQGEESKEGMADRPRHPVRGKYRTPPQRQDDEEESPGIMGFVQKAKTFYDIFRAMNSAWKTIEDRYRNNGQGIFLGEQQLNETTTTSTDKPVVTSGKTTKNPRPKPKKRRTTTTKAPTTSDEDEEGEEQQQARDEYRSRRSSLNEAANGQETAAAATTTTTSIPERESSSDEELESESDLESSESDSSSSSTSTDVAEGRYIKGDPLKGYYDFVITEGSYKFWAAFQVGTAILIIYSTFAAIYYSKVNPLVSDYDYIDYLGGGRSLSDDSDFVDTDAPAAATDDDTTNSDGSKTATAAAAAAGAGAGASGEGKRPEGTPPRGRRLQKQSSAGWFDWVPHAGHTLRFILEAIDKGYNEE